MLVLAETAADGEETYSRTPSHTTGENYTVSHSITPYNLMTHSLTFSDWAYLVVIY